MGDGPAGRRQHRDRRRPGGPARARRRAGRLPTAASSSTSPRGAPGWSPDTCTSRPPTVGAGGSRGRRSAPTPSRPWRMPPGWGRPPSTGTPTAGGPWSRLGHEDADPPARSRRARLHLLAAQPRRDGAGRRLARGLLRPRLRDRAGQPLGPDPVTVAAVPDQPELGLPGHPGRARDRRHRRRAAAAGQALDRLPEAGRPPAEGDPQTSCCTAWSGSRSRCSSRRRSSSSPPGWRTPPSGTPGTSTSAPPTTRSPGSPSAPWSCTSR